MGKYLTSLVATLLLSGLLSQAAWAQDRPIEIGTDAALTYQVNDELDGTDFPNVLNLRLPLRRLRVGFFVSDRVSIEPAVSFSLSDVEDVGFNTTVTLLGDLLYHFAPAGARGWFVHGGAAFAWNHVNPDDPEDSPLSPQVESDTDVQFGLGAGVGLNLPAAERLKLRLGLRYLYLFEGSGDRLSSPASSNVSGTAGVSFFVG